MNPVRSDSRLKDPEKIYNGVKQRTIKESVALEGVGLQTGNKVRLNLKTSPADSGINFIRTDLPNKPLLNIQSLNLKSSNAVFERRTALGIGPMQVQTIEHLLSALSALSIDNIVAELDSAELPGLDGSAKCFFDALKKAGLSEQNAAKKIFKVEKATWCQGKDNLIAVIPDDNFKVSYALSYEGTSLGTQFLSLDIDEKSFEAEIAPARTFCLEKEALELLKRGLGKGANYENTLVIGNNGPINNKFRFPDEPVRHKILDLIGDLYLVGMPIKGHVVAIKSGHTLNMELVKKLKSQI